MLGSVDNNEPFISAVDSCLFRITKDFLNTGHEDSALTRINSLAKNTNSLPSCVSAICSLLDFLNHSSEKVRNAAAEVLLYLLDKATFFLSSEKDPEKILEYISLILDAIEKLQHAMVKGQVKIGSFSKLQKILKLVKEIMLNTENHLLLRNTQPRYSNSDCFTNLQQKGKAELSQNNCIDSFLSANSCTLF